MRDRDHHRAPVDENKENVAVVGGKRYEQRANEDGGNATATKIKGCPITFQS